MTRKPKTPWTPAHSDTLRRMAHNHTNAQVAAWIEHNTGRRFSAFTVSRHRAALGLPHPSPVGYNAALRRWRAIEAGA